MAAMIEVSDVSKVFGSFTAVDRISFSVAEGSIRAFLGPNSAGKTTTIKMLTTVLTPTSGRLQVAGFDPVRQRIEVRRSFGIALSGSEPG